MKLSSLEDIGYFNFNCSEQLLNVRLFFNYCYCEYLACLELQIGSGVKGKKIFLSLRIKVYLHFITQAKKKKKEGLCVGNHAFEKIG